MNEYYVKKGGGEKAADRVDPAEVVVALRSGLSVEECARNRNMSSKTLMRVMRTHGYVDLEKVKRSGHRRTEGILAGLLDTGSGSYIAANNVSEGDIRRLLPIDSPVIYTGIHRETPRGLDWPAIREAYKARLIADGPEWWPENREPQLAEAEPAPPARTRRRATGREPSTPKPPRARTGAQPKLSVALQAIVVGRYLAGESASRLSSEFGISPPTVIHYVEHAGHQARSRAEAMQLVHRPSRS